MRGNHEFLEVQLWAKYFMLLDHSKSTIYLTNLAFDAVHYTCDFMRSLSFRSFSWKWLIVVVLVDTYSSFVILVRGSTSGSNIGQFLAPPNVKVLPMPAYILANQMRGRSWDFTTRVLNKQDAAERDALHRTLLDQTPQQGDIKHTKTEGKAFQHHTRQHEVIQVIGIAFYGVNKAWQLVFIFELPPALLYCTLSRERALPYEGKVTIDKHEFLWCLDTS